MKGTDKPYYRLPNRILFSVLLLVFQSIAMAQTHQTTEAGRQLLSAIQQKLAEQKGVFAIAFTDLQSGEEILWNSEQSFHAASTMKTPVMIEVYKQAAAGKLSLDAMVTVKNEFTSIADSSLYSLNPADDSQQELYKLMGTQIPLFKLVYEMIIMSSNLATNLIIEMADAKKITQTMRGLGAKNIQVLRGVEDGKAFAQGLNNTVTAYDLMLIYKNMAEGKIVNHKACDEMIQILLDQQHNTLIPAFLPKEVRVAHKTGNITGVLHDSGIVFLPDGRKYVLVILSRELKDEAAATAAMAHVSEMIYRYIISKSKS